MGFVVDPVHGRIYLPEWIASITSMPEIRRMMNIRQLGLKAFTGFPGAMHTRYTHCLGTMHLAEKLRSKLVKSKSVIQQERLMQNLENNKAALQAAAFFHDVGHGPFSHVLDYVTKKELHLDHTELSVEVVKKYKDVLENESISWESVCKIISKSFDKGNPCQYIREIIDGPLDVDKMDYLLRDSYHVGLKYGFDLDYLMDYIRILGTDDNLAAYQIGLDSSPKAITVAEHFILIWRSMYILVYYDQKTRIAEKMLEKAVLYAIKNDDKIVTMFANPINFLNIDESILMKMLLESKDTTKKITELIQSRKYFEVVHKIDLTKDISPDSKFMKAVLKSGPDEISEELSIKLSNNEEYDVIYDIIKSRTPKNIRVDKISDDGEPIELEQMSPIIEAMSKQKYELFVYVKPDVPEKEKIIRTIRNETHEVIEGWE
ncbi:MAG: HD domain-containing protein [Candidatus Thorarchaeota archaeon]|nr:HD domain-containing protein [Candidatus Thorarchaeota archaeon]